MEKQNEKYIAQQLTPYNVLRMQNAKTFKFQKNEMYPSIRPPISECSPEMTTQWLANTMANNGCGYYDLNSLTNFRNMDNENFDNYVKPAGQSFNTNFLCKCDRHHGKPLRRQFLSKYIDWDQVTPYELMRAQNLKTFNYEKCEKYPSIRPPIAQCNPEQNVEWLTDYIEEVMSDEVDVMDIWKNIPGKNTLGFYGVGSQIHTPEAVMFNQVISKSLRKASGPNRTPAVTPKPKLSTPSKISERNMRPPNMFLLNRQLLKSRIERMPNVRNKLKATHAFTMMHCARQTGFPFEKRQSVFSLDTALDRIEKIKRQQHGLRRKFKYCELQCGIKENMCTDYEWRKYKEHPSRYEEAYREEMEETKQEIIDEPRNYEELYEQLVTCFQRDRRPNPIYQAFDKCCDGFGTGGKGNDGGDGGHGGSDSGDWDTGFGDMEGEFEGEEDDLHKVTISDGTDVGKRGRKGKGQGQGDGGSGKKDDGKGDLIKGTYPESQPPRDWPDDQDIKDASKSSHGDDDSKHTKHPTHDKSKSKGDGIPEDCPCEVCKFMDRKNVQEDPPYIADMKKEEKRRRLRDYIKQMCHRQYIKNRAPEYRAPQRHCQAIDCQTCFCQNPKIAEYCDCLNAMQNLQKLLGPKHCIVNNELIFNVKNLKDRVCRRLCACL